MKRKDGLFYEDLNSVCRADFIPWEDLKGRALFITGATGLIGYALIRALAYCDESLGLGMKIIALVRNKKKAEERFKEILDGGMLKLIEGTVEQLPELKVTVDYVIHGASQTASREFIDHAVETIKTSVMGTINTLELAKEHKVSAYIYLSSMEVYGHPQRGHKVKETEIGAMTPLDLRNSYPISKQMAEAMCCAYAREYHVPAKIVRLTQTFGPGFHCNDNRIFAYFARCASKGKNIILKTKGETERSYLYTADAVTAVLTILLKGKSGQAYNAADENTYCSIAEMAETVAADAGICVQYDIEDIQALGYPDTLYMDLDTQLLKSLGWKPTGGVKP